MNDAPLATQIKETRARLGLTQSQAAAAWAVPVKTLQKWEQGIREPQGLALDALRQKLAGAMAGQVSVALQPQDEQPEAVPAPEAASGEVPPAVPSQADAYLAFLAAQAKPEPQAAHDDTTLNMPAAIPCDPLPLAAPVQVGLEWLPFVSVAHSYARYKEHLQTMPPETGGVGW